MKSKLQYALCCVISATLLILMMVFPQEAMVVAIAVAFLVICALLGFLLYSILFDKADHDSLY